MFKYNVDDETYLMMLDDQHALEIFESVNINREYLKKYMPWVDGVISIKDSLDFIKISKEKYAKGEGFDSGIWYDEKFVGTIGFHSMNKLSNEVSLGYWLDERVSGKGLVTKSAKAFIDYAFNVYKVNRVEIRCAKSNTKSRAIPIRLGFVQEGIIREGELLIHGREDLIVYGILKKEWKG